MSSRRSARRHAAHFGALAAEAQPHLVSSGQLPWFDRLAKERENILAALRFYCDAADADGALQIAVDLGAFAMMTGSHDLGSWVKDALDVPGGEDHPLRWPAAALAAMNAAASGTDAAEIDAGMAQLSQIAENLARTPVVGRPLLSILRPAVAFFAGLPELTDALIDEGLASGDPWTRAASRMFHANVAENNADLATMQTDTELALADFRVLGERWGLANTLSALATLLTLQGRLEQADAAFGEALGLMQQLRSREDETFLLVRQSDVALRRGDVERARVLMNRAVGLAEEAGGPEAAFMLAMFADLERQLGAGEVARAMADTALQRLEALPIAHPAVSHGRAITLAMAARTRLDTGEVGPAVELLHDGYAAAVQTRDAPLTAVVALVVVAAASVLGRPEHAAELLGAAAVLRGADDLSNLEVARMSADLRANLGDVAFELAYARGKGLDRDAALKRLDPAEALQRRARRGACRRAARAARTQRAIRPPRPPSTTGATRPAR